MAYVKSCIDPDTPSPDPLRVNVDGTAGTGKSFLIGAISTEVKAIMTAQGFENPIVCMAPTGIAAYGIRGWTLNFGLAIPVKNWGELGAAALGRLQTRWRNTKVLILDEKSMIGCLGFGKMDCCLHQVFPHSGEEILGGMAVLLFLEILLSCHLLVTNHSILMLLQGLGLVYLRMEEGLIFLSISLSHCNIYFAKTDWMLSLSYSEMHF